MNAKLQLIAQLRHSLGDVKQVESQLSGSGVRQLLDRAARARAIVIPGLPPLPTNAPGTSLAEQLLTAGKRGLEKLDQHEDGADLMLEELLGLEAVVLLVARPALFITNGDFPEPPKPWDTLLDQERDSIRRVIRSVGRIEVSFGLGHASMVGTGFLVAPDVVMTNRHVVEAFCRADQGTCQFMPGLTPLIDYQRERDSTSSAGLQLMEVLGVHDSPEIDLALIRVARQAGPEHVAPEPLTLASVPPESPRGRDVYIVGYPAMDREGLTPPQVLQDIFGGIYEVKRLQPGKVMNVHATQRSFSHDCSTLGGNSGSCVVDLQTGLVIGLHFAGSYRRANHAVALWELTNDPLLKSAGVRFAQAAP